MRNRKRQWWILIVSVWASAWGFVQLFWHPDRKTLTQHNYGLDRQGGRMAEAFRNIEAEGCTLHNLKDVTAEFCDQLFSQVAAKTLCFIALVQGIIAGALLLLIIQMVAS